MTLNWKIPALIFGPLLLCSTPSCAIYLTQTHYWLSLLIPFVGFYPGPISGNYYWQHHAASETMLTLWACLSLTGYVFAASYAWAVSSRLLAGLCAAFITLSTLIIYVRINWN
ncbi:MAG: hypothetical protein LV479_07245 [Methylacidiphilales bacterium]|nr:hypothetical protein [Candidatus Methylacidiphilales bacterium]